MRQIKRTGGKLVNQRCSTIGYKSKIGNFSIEKKTTRKPVGLLESHRLSRAKLLQVHRKDCLNRSFEYWFVVKIRELIDKTKCHDNEKRAFFEKLLLDLFSWRSILTSPVTRAWMGFVVWLVKSPSKFTELEEKIVFFCEWSEKSKKNHIVLFANCFIGQLDQID